MYAAAPARAIGRAPVIKAPIPRQAPPPKAKPATTDKFRAYLRHLMDQNGFETFEALARAGGFDASTLTRWYSGQQGPSISILHKIAGPLRVRFGDLLVAAGMATREQLGMESAPIPVDVQDLLADLDAMPPHDRQATVALIRSVLKYHRTIKPTPKKRSRSGQRQ